MAAPDLTATNIAARRGQSRHRPYRPLFHPLTRRPSRLGEILVSAGALSRRDLRAALEYRHNSNAPLGQVLLARGMISEPELARTMARQWGLGLIDLDRCPPARRHLLHLDPTDCLQVGCIPWRQQNGRVIIAVADPSKARDAVAACGLSGLPVAVAIAEPGAIRRYIETHFGHEIEENARLASPEDMNCRNWPKTAVAITLIGLMACMVFMTLVYPVAAFWVAFTFALFCNLGTTIARSAALAGAIFKKPAPTREGDNVVRLDERRRLPGISILIPMHREDKVVSSLVANVNKLDYPPELLDIKLVIEADDEITSAAIAAIDLPAHFDVIRVPAHSLQTKPRAMNYALNFCSGEIVGIFDAEDRPEQDQLRKVVQHLHYAPEDVACVQGRLDFYNPKHNWMSRCFTIEYAVWFSLLIKGTRAMGLPIPLGGTTVYFRRKHLEEVSGWDAHNVTEDADLGIRLFRFGYRAEYLPSTTWEEANSRPISWVKQRSRWLKGYMMTWWIHARQPVRLVRDLGFLSAAYVHILLMGGIVSYLSIPIFWGVLAGTFGFDLQGHLGGPGWLWAGAFVMMFAGQIVMLTAAFLAAAQEGKRHLIPWVPTLIFYWPLGAMAGFKALIEMVFAPHYWDKTEHGDYSEPDTLSQTSPSTPMEMPSRVGASTR